jgi:hypothetical protein
MHGPLGLHKAANGWADLCPASKFVEGSSPEALLKSPGNALPPNFSLHSSYHLTCSDEVNHYHRLHPSCATSQERILPSMASADELKALGNKAIAAKNFDEAM